MKRTIVFLYCIISSFSSMAQAPLWKVNESAFQYTMTFVSKLNMDGVQLSNPNDMVAAFVGSSCRGVSKLTYVSSAKSYYAYLTIFSNIPGEAISFYIYNSTANKVVKVSKTINFESYQNIGNLFQSFSIAEPALNQKAELLTFDFLNVKTLSFAVNPGSVKLSISESVPLSNLTPVFTLSKGARLYKNGNLQVSGSSASSFTAPVSYDVMSEDESTLTSYAINITQTLDPPLFYKKDAVCNTLGAIKVVSKREGVVVQLSYNGKQVDNKAITNGEAVFTGLLSGNYIASIGNDFKAISINQKVK